MRTRHCRLVMAMMGVGGCWRWGACVRGAGGVGISAPSLNIAVDLKLL